MMTKMMIAAGFASPNVGLLSPAKLIAAATTSASSASWSGPSTSLDAHFVARDSPTFAGLLCLASSLPPETLMSLVVIRSFSYLHFIIH